MRTRRERGNFGAHETRMNGARSAIDAGHDGEKTLIAAAVNETDARGKGDPASVICARRARDQSELLLQHEHVER